MLNTERHNSHNGVSVQDEESGFFSPHGITALPVSAEGR